MVISLAPEVIFHAGPLAITNSIFTAWIIIAVMLLGALLVRRSLSRLPGKFQSVLELIYLWLWDTSTKIIGRRDVAQAIIPYLLTIFFFILLSNWSGLLPGVGTVGVHGHHHGEEVLIPLFRAPTSDLNMVLVFSLFSMGYVQYLGMKYSGVKNYLGHFFNFRDPILGFVGLLELIGEFTRVISFTFRLFGNVFAGEVLIMVMFYLTTTLLPQIPLIPLPFFVLELMVGAIQAFIFCFLTMVFVALAVASHGHEDHGHDGNKLAHKSA